MKTLSCGELVAGCAQKFQGPTDDAILAQAGKHAVEQHRMELTPEIVEKVRAHIREGGTTSQ